jgi:hypothetical protein
VAKVVQFVDYGYRILSKGNELHKSTDGALKENASLELVIKDLKELLDRIKFSSSTTWPGFGHFRDESLKLANELLDPLDKLKVKGAPGRWKSIRKALKSIHSKDKIDSWIKKLDLMRQEFSIHIEADIL